MSLTWSHKRKEKFLTPAILQSANTYTDEGKGRPWDPTGGQLAKCVREKHKQTCQLPFFLSGTQRELQHFHQRYDPCSMPSHGFPVTSVWHCANNTHTSFGTVWSEEPPTWETARCSVAPLWAVSVATSVKADAMSLLPGSTDAVNECSTHELDERADRGDRAVWGVDLRPLASWDCGFEFCWGNACLSLASVVCCQVEVSATSRSHVQRSTTDCCVSECNRETSVRIPGRLELSSYENINWDCE